jgi:hypothetical protein
MRSPKEISVGNGWYWLAGVLVALVGLWFYAAVVDPILPALAWHRAHSRKMQFAEFRLDVPLLWSVPRQTFNSPTTSALRRQFFPEIDFPVPST